MAGEAVAGTASHQRRLFRSVAYALFTGAGILALFFPPQPISAALGGITPAWGIYLAIGGALCLVTPLTDRWLGEYVGLPLLWSSIGFYAATAAVTPPPGYPLRLVAAVVLSGLAALLFDRWLDLLALSKASRHGEHHGERA